MELVGFEDIGQALGVPGRRVAQYVREGQLAAVSTGGGPPRVPAEFVQDGAIVKALPGVITLLRDARFDDPEIVEWLFRGDDTLPGTPIEALRADRGSEVKRRAQAAGY